MNAGSFRPKSTAYHHDSTVSHDPAATAPKMIARNSVIAIMTTETTRRMASGSTSSMNDSSKPCGASLRASQMLKPSTTSVISVPITKSTARAASTRRKLLANSTESNHRKST